MRVLHGWVVRQLLLAIVHDGTLVCICVDFSCAFTCLAIGFVIVRSLSFEFVLAYVLSESAHECTEAGGFHGVVERWFSPVRVYQVCHVLRRVH